MDIQEISDLAKTHEEALLAHRMTRNELVSVLALLTARIYSKIYTDTPPSGQVHPVIEAVLDTIKPPSKPVKYDPVYDPVPPLGVDKVPERPKSNNIIAQPNDACVCTACAKHIYTVNRLVKEGDKVDDFLKSYTPMSGVKPLVHGIRISNTDNQISTDCPVCGSSMSLQLAKGPQRGGL